MKLHLRYQSGLLNVSRKLHTSWPLFYRTEVKRKGGIKPQALNAQLRSLLSRRTQSESQDFPRNNNTLADPDSRRRFCRRFFALLPIIHLSFYHGLLLIKTWNFRAFPRMHFANTIHNAMVDTYELFVRKLVSTLMRAHPDSVEERDVNVKWRGVWRDSAMECNSRGGAGGPQEN